MPPSPNIMKPLLLIDIDGVLCPFAETPGYEWHEVGNTGIWASQRNARAFQERLAPLFEMTWCSGWEENANPIIGAIHGFQLPHVPLIGRLRLTDATWKLSALKQFLEDREDQPVAWIDDDLHEDAFLWAERRSAPTLLIRTDHECGLTEAEIQRLEEWGRQHGATDHRSSRDGA